LIVRQYMYMKVELLPSNVTRVGTFVPIPENRKKIRFISSLVTSDYHMTLCVHEIVFDAELTETVGVLFTNN
jgi:hypothetical protein